MGVWAPVRRAAAAGLGVRRGARSRAGRAGELGGGMQAPTPRGKPKPATAGDPDLQRGVEQLRQRFQTQIRIQSDERRGRIEIDYFGAEDLERITGMLLGDG